MNFAEKKKDEVYVQKHFHVHDPVLFYKTQSGKNQALQNKFQVILAAYPWQIWYLPIITSYITVESQVVTRTCVIS